MKLALLMTSLYKTDLVLVPLNDLLLQQAASKHINIRKLDAGRVSVSFDETVSANDLRDLIDVFAASPIVWYCLIVLLSDVDHNLKMET